VATLNLQLQLFVGGVWTTYAGYQEQGWSSQIGPDVESGLQPNQLNFVLNNDDLTMDPTNPASALYGTIGRNTPARILLSGTDLIRGEASSWKPERTEDHVIGTSGVSSIAVAAQGLQRRLGRWDDPLQSPMVRQTLSYSSLLGYWPLEDASSAQNLAQLVSRVPPGAYSGSVSLAGDIGAGGSDRLLTLGSDGLIGGTFTSSSGSGFQVCFCVKLDAVVASATYLPLLSFVDTLQRRWDWNINNTTFQISVTDVDGTVLETGAAGYGTLNLLNYTRFRLRVTISGGTITYEPAWYPQDSLSITGFTDTFAATATGRPRSWSAAGNTYTDGAAYGHVFAVSDTVLDLTTTFSAVASFNGYLNERAGDPLLADHG
jgi:hypothetical protein